MTLFSFIRDMWFHITTTSGSCCWPTSARRCPTRGPGCERVAILERNHSTHSGRTWTKEKTKNKNTHDPATGGITADQCPQTQQSNTVLGLAADKWLSPTGHKALMGGGYMCKYVHVSVFVCARDRRQRETKVIPLDENTLLCGTCTCKAAQTNTYLPAHTDKHKQAIIIPLLRRCSISTD